jgi:hypothetical protein
MSHNTHPLRKVRVNYCGKRYMVIFRQGLGGPVVYVNVSRKGVRWSSGAVNPDITTEVVELARVAP